MTEHGTKDYYLSLADKYGREAALEEKKIIYLSAGRLVLFVTGAILVWLTFSLAVPAALVLALVFLILFLYLVVLYTRHSEKKIFLENIVQINRSEALAFDGDLSSFDGGGRFSEQGHHFAADLDLFGQGSLFSYLNRTVTDYGQETLAGWLADPYPLAAHLEERQEAIRELAQQPTWRQHFAATGLRRPLGREEIKGLSEWLSGKEEEGGIIPRLITLYIMPALTLLLLVFVLTGLVNYTVFILVFLFNLLLTALLLKRTNHIHRSVSGIYGYLSSVSSLLELFSREEFTSGILKHTRSELTGKGLSAASSIKRLSKLIQAFDSRLNIIAGFLLNGLLLWDFQLVSRLGTWKRVYGSQIPGWLEMAGRIDALNSLAGYAFNNPGFAWPRLSDDGIIFSASEVGHPLIAPGKRICNDFTVAHEGRICIITGANMSGKSTFLRTVAVNSILAMAGAPVCAGSMVFTPVKLFTSMRTTDSLSGNESYFYAELRRLRYLREEILKGEPVFFILDEILKGTNSSDKSLGSLLFIRKLAELGATGLIATHDTSLGELEKDFPEKVENKCFEVDIEGDNIIFDYKIRDGLTLKMNAAFLMRQMGILD